MPSKFLDTQEVRQAWAEHDRQVTISNFKVACTIGALTMPAGVVLDKAMYPKLAGQFSELWIRTEVFPTFLQLRLVCAALILLFLGILLTPFGHKHYRLLGVTLFMLPASFIAWMIAKCPDGATSPYYAGLNLVILVLAFVLHWTFWESFTAATLVILLYVGASVAAGLHSGVRGEFTNNLYFLVLTGVIVMTGSYFHSKTRFREFAFRYELDKNKKALEQSNQKLDSQNKELADTLQKLTAAESQLVQQEKMAALGVMSAGIIHEMNNPLNFATTGLFTLRKKSKYVAPDQQADFEDIVKDVEDGISRVKNIVSDLRMFTHPDTDSLDEVEVSEAVTSALRFLSNEWKDKVHIEQKLPEHQTVRANKNKLIHVLTNLLQNSLDAMREKSFNGEQPTIWIEGRVENGASILTVRDNGPGIASEHVGKIFDPFFTTKDVGDGMGLGLSICYRIVQESKGKISVRTEPGKFCEFTLEFPVKG
jgi:two-component system sensor histidine kinase PhcS